MAGVEGLDEPQYLRAAHLADDEAVRSQAQRRAHELFERDRGESVRCGGSGLEAHEVVVVGEQFRGVLDDDDPLAGSGPGEHGVEERRLARRCRAGDEHVAPAVEQLVENVGHVGGGERGERKGPVAEATHREAGPVEGDGRDDRTHSRAILQTGVDDRVGAVEAAAERGEDALDDDGEIGRGDRPGGSGGAVALDPDVATGIDEDLVDVVVAEEGVERTETVEARHRGAHEALAVGRGGERSDPPDVGPDDGVGVAVVLARRRGTGRRPAAG